MRLRDVLEYCGIKSDAKYIGYYGADVRLDGNTEKEAISRGVPMSKALEDETLIAWAYEGGDIPHMNGYPLRLAIGGWPASVSGKWLTKIVVRNKVHDGEKMGGQSYRVPCTPVAPGEDVPDENMCIIEGMVVKSIITYPVSGIKIKEKQALRLRGKAWAGDHQVKEMFISIDFGATWQRADLKAPFNRLAWQEWNAMLDSLKKGITRFGRGLWMIGAFLSRWSSPLGIQGAISIMHVIASPFVSSKKGMRYEKDCFFFSDDALCKCGGIGQRNGIENRRRL